VGFGKSIWAGHSPDRRHYRDGMCRDACIFMTISQRISFLNIHKWYAPSKDSHIFVRQPYPQPVMPVPRQHKPFDSSLSVLRITYMVRIDTNFMKSDVMPCDPAKGAFQCLFALLPAPCAYHHWFCGCRWTHDEDKKRQTRTSMQSSDRYDVRKAKKYQTDTANCLDKTWSTARYTLTAPHLLTSTL
jgi:hypothetical protein